MQIVALPGMVGFRVEGLGFRLVQGLGHVDSRWGQTSEFESGRGRYSEMSWAQDVGRGPQAVRDTRFRVQGLGRETRNHQHQPGSPKHKKRKEREYYLKLSILSPKPLKPN